MRPRVLLLAKYAGTDHDVENAAVIKEHAQYHYELEKALSEKCDVIPSNNLSDIESFRDSIDFVFPVFNNAGFVGAESFPAAQCERFGIPYLGARPSIRGVAEDKHLGKILATHAGVNTPAWVALRAPYDITSATIEHINPPYFIKPRYGRNSEGISGDSIQHAPKSVIGYLHGLEGRLDDVIVEHAVSGTYCTVPAWMREGSVEVLSPIMESLDGPGPVTMEHKTHVATGLRREFSDNDEFNKRCESAVRSMYSLMEPLDFARFDFMYDYENNDLEFLEANVCCSLSKRSTFYMAVRERHDISYDEFIAVIFNESLARQTRGNQR